jgi:hypothetical protein
MLLPSSLTPKINHEATEVVGEGFEVEVAEDVEEEADSTMHRQDGRRSRVTPML